MLLHCLCMSATQFPNPSNSLSDLMQPYDGLGAARQRAANDLSPPSGEPPEGDLAPQRQRSQRRRFVGWRGGQRRRGQRCRRGGGQPCGERLAVAAAADARREPHHLRRAPTSDRLLWRLSGPPCTCCQAQTFHRWLEVEPAEECLHDPYTGAVSAPVGIGEEVISRQTPQTAPRRGVRRTIRQTTGEPGRM